MSRAYDPGGLFPCVRVFLFLLCASSLTGCVSTVCPGQWDLGPLGCRDTDAHGRDRLRLLGPLWEQTRADNGETLLAFRPFYSRYVEPQQQRTRHDVLWPLVRVQDRHTERSWRLLIFYGTDYDRNRSDSRYRVNLFPLVFWGRDSAGRGYFAVFPLGGTIREDFTQEWIRFVLFPLYFSHAYAHGTESRSVLWPLITWSEGPGFTQRRFLPFYAHSEYAGRSRHRFVVFPFWTQSEYMYPESHGCAYILFPLYGRAALSDQDTWWVLPPLFRWARNRAGYRAVNAPWPFLQYRRGGIDRFYVWPLWGREQDRNVRSWFFLWPVVQGSEVARGERVIERWTILPVFYSKREILLRTGDHPGDVPEERCAGAFRVWPLGVWHYDPHGMRMRLPELWPAASAVGIERCWAPFWSLYTRERVGATADTELLWGLFRYRRGAKGMAKLSLFPLFCCTRATDSAGDRSRCSILLGLLTYERNGNESCLRLAGLPLWRLGTAGSPSRRVEESGTADARRVLRSEDKGCE